MGFKMFFLSREWNFPDFVHEVKAVYSLITELIDRFRKNVGLISRKDQNDQKRDFSSLMKIWYNVFFSFCISLQYKRLKMRLLSTK